MNVYVISWQSLKQLLRYLRSWSRASLMAKTMDYYQTYALKTFNTNIFSVSLLKEKYLTWERLRHG